MKLLIALAAVVLVMIAFLVWFAPDTREWNPLPEIRNAAHVDEARPTLADVEPRATAKAQSAANDAPIEATRSIIHAATWELAGFVLSPDGKTPVAHASVGLFAPAKLGDGPESDYCGYSVIRDNESTRRYRCIRRWTATDETGRFVFDEPDAGTWIVRADLGSLLACASDPVEITAGISRSDLRLVMPAECWIAGKVLGPEDARFDKMRVTLVPHGPSSVPVLRGDKRRLDRMLVAAIDEDGSYRIGPTETGLHALGIELVGPATDPENLISGGPLSVPVADVFAAMGETHFDIDLRKGFPGSMRIKIELSGAEPAAVGLSRCALFAVPVATRGAGADYIEMHVRVGEDPIELGPLVPGDWMLAIASWPSQTWIWRYSGIVRMEPGRAVDVHALIPFVRAVLELRDARDGEPYAAKQVSLGFGIDNVFGTRGMRDLSEPGKIELFLPTGSYKIEVDSETETGDDFSTESNLEWTLDGPLPKVLKLRPK